jgi:hypothetical protein
MKQLPIYLEVVCGGGLGLAAASFAKRRLERRIFGGLFKNLQAYVFAKFWRAGIRYSQTP